LTVRLGVVAGYAVVVTAAAVAVFRFVEEPARRWMRRQKWGR